MECGIRYGDASRWYDGRLREGQWREARVHVHEVVGEDIDPGCDGCTAMCVRKTGACRDCLRDILVLG